MSAHFRFAREQDNKGILKIMENDAAKGDIQLIYTRRPDPCRSFLAESDKACVGVFEDNGKVAATIAAIPHPMYLQSKVKNVCYVTNMKRAEDYDGRINWPAAFREMYEPVAADVFFCSVVKENTKVLKMLEKKRRKLPYAVPMGEYRTYIISPTAKVKDLCPQFSFRRACVEDTEEVLRFLDTYGSRKNFFPVIRSLGGENLPAITDFYLLFDREQLIALGALWDRSKSKQYIVKQYSGRVALLRRFNPLISRLGYIQIPKAGEQAAFVFLSFFLAKDDAPDAYQSFLSRIRKEAAGKYDMFVLGTNGQNPKRKILDSVRAITFDTLLCELKMSHFLNKPEILFDYSALEVECALL